MISNREHALVMELINNQDKLTRLTVIEELNVDTDISGRMDYMIADLHEDNALLWAELNGVKI